MILPGISGRWLWARRRGVGKIATGIVGAPALATALTLASRLP